MLDQSFVFDVVWQSISCEEVSNLETKLNEFKQEMTNDGTYRYVFLLYLINLFQKSNIDIVEEYLEDL